MIGDNIKYYRKLNKMTQAELGKQISCVKFNQVHKERDCPCDCDTRLFCPR